ncbi:DHA2 family efflux MFS transporter permease subunit, partial [Nitratireductor sp. GCM10026969]|uniref:DHA2 family efflux MFS transporter permease subunit n=1 Tax=Nitratireductor sp. GCM10026969 TaxID=3252645 RepID=UPI003617BD6B
MQLKADIEKPPRIPARVWRIAAVTGAGAFMAMLDSTVANLALETIRADLGATLPVVQWVASGYLIALAVSLPATGWLGARFGYGRVWAASLLIFVAASVLCALAPGPSSLIAARFIQGLGAGLMVPAGQAVIGATAERNQLGRLMGVLGFVVALGPALGPAVGGFLLEAVSWRWLFWINVPIGLAALLAARGLVPPGARDTERTLDLHGLAFLVFGLPLLLYAATKTGTDKISIGLVTACLLGAGLVAAFVVHALRMRHPLIDFKPIRRPAFAAAVATAGLTGVNMYGGLLLVPLYLQLPAAQGAGETGLMLLAMGLGSAFVLPVAGTLTDRHGPGLVALA